MKTEAALQKHLLQFSAGNRSGKCPCVIWEQSQSGLFTFTFLGYSKLNNVLSSFPIERVTVFNQSKPNTSRTPRFPNQRKIVQGFTEDGQDARHPPHMLPASPDYSSSLSSGRWKWNLFSKRPRNRAVMERASTYMVILWNERPLEARLPSACVHPETPAPGALL